MSELEDLDQYGKAFDAVVALQQYAQQMLYRILRYELAPDTLKPMDHRSHKRKVTPEPTLWDIIDAPPGA